jgi:hypothetical protein
MVALSCRQKNVQERLGHSSIVITMDTYGHLFPPCDDGTEMATAERALLVLTATQARHAGKFVCNYKEGRRLPKLYVVGSIPIARSNTLVQSSGRSAIVAVALAHDRRMHGAWLLPVTGRLRNKTLTFALRTRGA